MLKCCLDSKSFCYQSSSSTSSSACQLTAFGHWTESPGETIWWIICLFTQRMHGSHSLLFSPDLYMFVTKWKEQKYFFLFVFNLLSKSCIYSNCFTCFDVVVFFLELSEILGNLWNLTYNLMIFFSCTCL